MSDLRIGLAGLGTVGATVAARLLVGAVHGATLVCVSARDPRRDRGVNLSGVSFFTDPMQLVASDNVDVVVELIGGADGQALDLVMAALKAGKSVVTANKAMLAAHADSLSALSVTKNIALAFEAAIAGGIPVVKTLREGLAGNDVRNITGILNGTCNYILSRMERDGLDFEAALHEAQEKGFAEADPTLDISGVDTGQKLALLSALAFQRPPDMARLPVTGIERITAQDIFFAGQFGYVIRLIGWAQLASDGVCQRVAPVLVPVGSMLAQTHDELNAVMLTGEPVGKIFLQGSGAGGGATASAVLADIADLSLGFGRPLFAKNTRQMRTPVSLTMPDCAHYLRLALADRPGSMARATQILAENGVSIEEVVQRSSNEGDSFLPVVFITHKVDESSLNGALEALRQQKDVCEDVLSLSIFTA